MAEKSGHNGVGLPNLQTEALLQAMSRMIQVQLEPLLERIDLLENSQVNQGYEENHEEAVAMDR